MIAITIIITIILLRPWQPFLIPSGQPPRVLVTDPGTSPPQHGAKVENQEENCEGVAGTSGIC